jgi:tagatose-6-phosphate ketose/aldose isomerase
LASATVLMSYVHQDTLVMCFLSSDPTLRAYETDLLGELDRKGLGLLKVVIGEDIPVELIRGHDVAIECQGLSRLGDEDSTEICVIAGQLSAFFSLPWRGIAPGFAFRRRVIRRVVQTFALYSPEN